MSVISVKYFSKGTLRIEGLNERESIAATATCGMVGRYIEEYEREYLEHVLGYELTEEFLRYIQDNDGSDEAFDGLLSMLQEFKGVENRSPIANFVFFHFIRNASRNATALGVTENSTDNRLVSSDSLAIRAWNDMAKMNKYVLWYLRKNLKGRFCFNPQMVETINPLGI